MLASWVLIAPIGLGSLSSYLEAMSYRPQSSKKFEDSLLLGQGSSAKLSTGPNNILMLTN
jgi:hypothetical protein